MPRLKPPRAQALAPRAEPAPNEEVTIDLDSPMEEPREVDLAPEPKPLVAAERATTQEPAPAEDDAVKRALEATQRADALQRQLAQAQVRETELSRDRDDAQYNSVLTAIAAEQSTLDKAESDYAAFASAGDWGNAAKAQRIIATASARVDRLEENKQTFDVRREEAKRQPAREPAAPAIERTTDQEIDRLGVPIAAKEYLRSHPELISDPNKRTRLGKVHSYIEDTVSLYSTDYFRRLDEEFGFKSSTEPASGPTPTQPRRSMPVSAPVSRETHTPNGQRRNNSITLTPEEREIARNAFGSVHGAPDLTPDQKERLYAENKAKLNRMRASGEYRQTTEQTG